MFATIYELNTVAGMHAIWPYVILCLRTILLANLVARRPAFANTIGFHNARWRFEHNSSAKDKDHDGNLGWQVAAPNAANP